MKEYVGRGADFSRSNLDDVERVPLPTVLQETKDSLAKVRAGVDFWFLWRNSKPIIRRVTLSRKHVRVMPGACRIVGQNVHWAGIDRNSGH
jgi:hypothetical protein